ncbi:uncharacterized protein [Pagrus major]|uniref:uncharacterized protein n=1 Tax=Pagrus major TaxID=143350 RepID=UPI003CC8ADF9
MSPLTPEDHELSCLRSELRSIATLLDDVLQRQSSLLARVEALQQDGPSPANAVHRTSDAPSSSWATVVRKGRPVSLPLFSPDMEECDDDPIPLSNFFTPLEKLAELPATCSRTAPEQSVLPNSRHRKRRIPPTSPLMSQGKRPRCSSPSSVSFSEIWPPLPAPQPSFPRPNVGPIPSTLNDDVICAGDSNPSSTVPDPPGISHLSLSSKLSVYDNGCKNQPPEILIIGDSIIRNVHLPGSITYCLSGGITTDFIELIPVLIDLHPSVHTVLLHTGTNDVMSRRSCKLYHDLESLIHTVESLGKRCVLSGPIPTLLKSSERFSRLFSLHTWMQNFTTATADHLPDKLESLSNTSMSVNNLTDGLNSALSETLESFAPLRTSRGTRTKSAPWFSDLTRSLKRACRKLEDRWRTCKSESSRLAWTLSFKHYKHALSAARSSYFSNLIETNKNNHRVLFNTVARLTHSSPVLSSPFTANDFLVFFTDKISQLRNNIISQQLSSTVSSQCSVSWSTSSLSQFKPISAETLASMVAASKPTTCSLDPIPSDLLKELLPILNAPIRAILNTSLSEGCVPLTYKSAIIKPLLKKPNSDPLVLANYRPVSTLPFLSKILERIVADQLTVHLSTNNLFDNFQSGFRSCHSTETALTRVVNDLLVTADSGSASILLILDLSSAFDTVDHCVLLHRLEHYVGIHGLALSWFQSYLSSRTQCVSFNNSLSECSTVTAGVPQGSVLGPLLFCIYMLPLGRIIAEYGIQFHFYADDTQLYIPLHPNDPSQIQNLETCVSQIKIWMSQNFLMLNTAKTDLLVIKPNNCKYFSDSLCLNIDGCSISESTHIRNLGVIFDPTLTFQTHIKEITRTAFFHLRNIAKIRPALSRRSAEVVLHALVSSRLDYCNVLFSGLPICTTRSLQLVQNSAARLLTKTSRFCHITPVLASLHWLPIQARADFKVLLLTYKALNGLAPSYLTELLSPYIPPRPLRSLSSNLLVIPPINKKSAGGRAFAYRAPFLWNGLPLGIKEATSTAIFKSRLKTHLFTQYFGLN